VNTSVIHNKDGIGTGEWFHDSEKVFDEIFKNGSIDRTLDNSDTEDATKGKCR
jgi:hypothetical protein